MEKNGNETWKKDVNYHLLELSSCDCLKKYILHLMKQPLQIKRGWQAAL